MSSLQPPSLQGETEARAGGHLSEIPKLRSAGSQPSKGRGEGGVGHKEPRLGTPARKHLVSFPSANLKRSLKCQLSSAQEKAAGSAPSPQVSVLPSPPQG